MAKLELYDMPLDVPAIKEQGVAYDERTMPGSARYLAPTAEQQAKKGNVLDTTPWAKPARAPVAPPFKNLRQR